MVYELNWFTGALLVLTGGIAGFINILAAGGSLLTLPALMLLGMPADIANATNRVGIFFQAVEGMRGFHRHGKLPREALISVIAPTLAGSLVGSLIASYMPSQLLEPTLLTTLIVMAVVMVLRPSIVAPQPREEPIAVKDSPVAWLGLFISGIYGGFVQAGVGFVLLAVLAGVLRYDLVRANALKVASAGLFTAVALVVFIARDQILWIPGLLLGLGAVIGARISVKVAITVNQAVLRLFLLFMVIVVCLAVWFK